MATIYITLLITATIIIFFCFKESFKAPFKIKIITIITLFFLFFRYVSLLLCFFNKSILWLYSLKYVYFLNIMAIPIIMLLVSYIILRKNTISFNYIIAIAIMFYILYPYLISQNTDGFSVNLFSNYLLGYSITSENGFINVFYGAVNLIVLLFILIVLNNRNPGTAVILATASALISIVEVVAQTINLQIFPQYLLGEIFWLITLNYMLKELKRRKR